MTTLARLAALFIVPLCGVAAGCNTGDAPLGLIGRPAPALALASHPLEHLRGHVVLLNFWASWCGPCLVELPSLEALQQQMPDVTILAVSFDRDPEAYARFLKAHRVSLRTELDTTGRSNGAYGTTAPPETFVVDKRGVVRRKFIGSQDWTSPEIENYLRSLE